MHRRKNTKGWNQCQRGCSAHFDGAAHPDGDGACRGPSMPAPSIVSGEEGGWGTATRGLRLVIHGLSEGGPLCGSRSPVVQTTCNMASLGNPPLIHHPPLAPPCPPPTITDTVAEVSDRVAREMASGAAIAPIAEASGSQAIGLWCEMS